VSVQIYAVLRERRQTAWRVADLIERACGVAYSTVHAWRVLRALGWPPQRPAGRALERNEAAIRRWMLPLM